MKVTLLHSTGNNRSFPLPTDLGTSTGLSDTFPTRFHLCKGVPSLFYIPLVASSYHCWFLSNKNQVVILYYSNLDLGLLCSRVAINLLCNFPIFLKDKFSIDLFLRATRMSILLTASSICESTTHSI
jgi:hypothetical protein